MYKFEIVEDRFPDFAESISVNESDEIELHSAVLTEEEVALLISEENQLEFERKHVKNLREKTAILIQLIDKHTEIDYNYPPRTKHEINGGYKIAKERQRDIFINLKSINVFNLYFRFRNQKINALTTSAMMFRERDTKQETILLFPDLTKDRYEMEKRRYIDVANDMVFAHQYPMEPDYQSILIENLNKLNVHERCAQSLLHEYGHILHYRLFDQLNIKSLSDIYAWFHQYRYTDLILYRSPEYHDAPDSYKVYLLKESLVEDYRIYLNMLNKNGMFILPNINTFEGDFRDPSLLIEGVRCMKDMFRDFIDMEKRGFLQSNASQEPNRIDRVIEIHSKAQSTGWYPGKYQMTEFDHQEVIERLKALESKENTLQLA